MKILAVEDDSACKVILRERLGAGGLPTDRLVFCTTLHEAGNVAMTFEPDVILFDLVLPDSTADNTLSSLINFTRLYPVLVLTGHDKSDFWKRAISQSGAMDYLYKVPFLARGNEAFLAHAILNAVWLYPSCRS